MKKNNFWVKKKVFITGINGFIGGNLTKSLLAHGATVYGLIRNEKRDSFLYIENLADKVCLIRGELTDKELMTRIISEEQINIVFHLAAQVEVGVGITNPYLTFETNIRGTYTLLESVRICPKTIEAFVVASSDKAYGSYPKDQMPYKEDYPLRPRYPYDISKACADLIAQAYATELYKLPVVITRFSNIYGPGQLNFSAIMPDAITSALGYTKFVPRGNGKMVRDFIYVEDVVNLYLRIGESLASNPDKIRGEIFNAGTNSPISVKEVLEAIYTIAQNPQDLDVVISLMKDKKTAGEIDCQYMDYKKVYQYFYWKPKYTFKEGLKKTIQWYTEYNNKKSKI
jgi:CDP-glucose 4,6-dehydratase